MANKNYYFTIKEKPFFCSHENLFFRINFKLIFIIIQKILEISKKALKNNL